MSQKTLKEQSEELEFKSLHKQSLCSQHRKIAEILWTQLIKDKLVHGQTRRIDFQRLTTTPFSGTRYIQNMRRTQSQSPGRGVILHSAPQSVKRLIEKEFSGFFFNKLIIITKYIHTDLQV